MNGEENFGWGAVVNFQKKANQSKVRINLNFFCFANTVVTLHKFWKIFLAFDLLPFMIFMYINIVCTITLHADETECFLGHVCLSAQ